jgi:hypothetical protein
MKKRSEHACLSFYLYQHVCVYWPSVAFEILSVFNLFLAVLN